MPADPAARSRLSRGPRGRGAPGPAPDGWGVVAAYAAVCLASQVVWITYAVVTTPAAEALGASETAIGWLTTCMPVLFVVLAVPAGLLLDRHFDLALAAGAALTAAGAAVRLLDDSYAWALTGQVVAGVGQPLVLTAVTGLVTRTLTPERRALGIAVASGATSAGLLVGFALGGLLSTAAQLMDLVLIGAVLAMVTALWLLLALARAPRPTLPLQPTPPGHRSALGAIWADPVIRRLVLLTPLPFGTFLTLSTWTQALLEPAGVDASDAGAILALTIATGIAATVVLPAWAERAGRELAALVGGLGVTALGCVVLALTPGRASAFVTMAVVGAALVPVLPVVLQVVERRAGVHAGTATGLIWLVGNLGGAVLGALVGGLLDHPGTAYLLLAAAALVPLAGIGPLRSPALAARVRETVQN